MKYQDLINKGKIMLEEQGLDLSLINILADQLLCINDIDKINNITIEKDQEKNFFNAIKSLINGKPIQYIIGFTNFYGYKFRVTNDVLIPRFETEELVENTINYVHKYFKDKIDIVDIGTGSGIIGITLKKELKNINITMTDFSRKALIMAQSNAKKLDVEAQFVHGDMLNPLIKKHLKYDVIISNPPYISKEEEVMPLVKNNEPAMALYGGDDGLKYYQQIFEGASKVLKEKSFMAFEIGPDLVPGLIKLVNQYFKDSQYIIKKDLQGRDRMLFIFNNLSD